MEFRVLGPIEVVDQTGRVEIGGARQRRLLCSLIAGAGSVVSRDRLFEEVWEDDDRPSDPGRALRTYVARLRSALGPAADVIQTAPPGYLFDPGEHSLDAAEFEKLTNLAGASSAHSERSPSLAAALGLWRGSAYEEFADLHWLTAEAERLEELRLVAIGGLIDAWIASGDHAEAVAELERAVAEHPYREPFRKQMAEALWRSGRQAEALRTLHAYRRLLATKTGLEPGGELLQLEAKILAGAASNEPVYPPVKRRLPAEVTPFIGREREVEELCDLLRHHRLVTLVAMGGMGKTRLACAAAEDATASFPGGVCFVDLTTANSLDQVVDMLADALGFELAGNDRLGSLAELLDNRSLLLILDNCEHLIDAASHVTATALNRVRGPVVLATSREPMGLTTERIVNVQSLSTKSDDRSPAVELFIASAERAGTTVPDEQLETAARICRELDGLPLSLELAASQLRHLTLPELAARLDDRFELLTDRRRGRGDRQASLAAVLDEAWSLLDPYAQALLLQLAAFPSGFGADEVEAVSPNPPIIDPLGCLSMLVGSGLVARDRRGQLRLLETTKLYVRRKWDLDQTPNRFLERHATWVLDHLAAQPAQDWYTSLQLVSWGFKRQEDLLAAEQHLASDHDPARLVQLMEGLAQTYAAASRNTASTLIDRLDTYLTTLPLTDRDRGALLVVKALAAAFVRRTDLLDATTFEAIELLRPDGPSETLAVAQWLHAGSHRPSDHQASLTLMHEAQTMADEIGADAIADLVLAFRCTRHYLYNEEEEAEQALEELTDRLRRHGRQDDFALNCFYAIKCAVDMTRSPDDAHDCAQELLELLARPLGHESVNWNIYNMCAATAAANGDATAAHAFLQQAERRLSGLAESDGVPDVLLAPTALAWSTDQTNLATEWMGAIQNHPELLIDPWATLMARRLEQTLPPATVTHRPIPEAHEAYRHARDWLEDVVAGEGHT